MSKHTFHLQTPLKYLIQLGLLHLLICSMGMRCVPIQLTIQVLGLHVYVGLFWSAGVPVLFCKSDKSSKS